MAAGLRSKGAAWLVAALGLLLGLAWWFRHFRDEIELVFVADTVHMTACAVSDLLRDNPDPTDEQVREAILVLDQASICRLWYGPDGQIVDAWGTPLLLQFFRGHPETPTTCRSAGPDRVPGTSDDIAYSCP